MITKKQLTIIAIAIALVAIALSYAFPDFGLRLGSLLIIFVVVMGPALFAEEAFDITDRLNARLAGEDGRRWSLFTHFLIAALVAGVLALVWPSLAISLLKDEASLARQWLEFTMPVEEINFRLMAGIMALFGYLFEPLYFWLLERR